MRAFPGYADRFATRLRAAILPWHDALEAGVDLDMRLASRVAYRDWLVQFHGLYLPLEVALEEAIGRYAVPFDLMSRRKAPLLAHDLAVLGVPGAPSSPRVCTDLPVLRNAGAVWGCLYVLEGATLGGQVVGRRLRERLQVTPATGGAFFDSYGPLVLQRWTDFRKRLADAAGNCDAERHIIDAACATFDSFARWLHPVPKEDAR